VALACETAGDEKAHHMGGQAARAQGELATLTDRRVPTARLTEIRGCLRS